MNGAVGVPENAYWGKLRRNSEIAGPSPIVVGAMTDPKVLLERAAWCRLQLDPSAVSAWHPLQSHCADVGAVTEALLGKTLLRKRLARFMGWDDLSPEECARLAVLACLHDLGKFNHGFQGRWHEGAPLIGHVKEILAVFEAQGAWSSHCDRVVGLLEVLGFYTWGEGSDRLLVASLSHHGCPRPIGQAVGIDAGIWADHRGRSPLSGMAEFMQQLPLWFPLAFGGAARPFPEITEAQHAFSGLVTLADWIGSDEGFFAYGDANWQSRMAVARPQAQRVVEAMGLDGTLVRDGLGEALTSFASVSDYPPTQVQLKMSDLPTGCGGTIGLTESETGSGKTEGALADFVHKLRDGLVDGLYFALPTRSAATQMYDRVVIAVAKAFPDAETRPSVVLAVPGYLKADGVSGTRLPAFKVLWPDDPSDATAHQRWAAEGPKRFLVGTVVVGTIDQVLLSVLAVRHSHMRACALSRHLLVVDEVHASDAYMGRLLEVVVKRHVGAGGHVLLLSATLGASLRAKLFSSTGAGPGLEPLAQARTTAYPAITWADQTGDYKQWAPESMRSKTIKVRMEPWVGDPVAIAQAALIAAKDGARVVILRNTVADCLATQQTLEHLAKEQGVDELLFKCQGLSAPHHSRFVGTDRAVLDQALATRYGPGCQTGCGCILVATQTIQQSLDLDADWLLTDLCPMDVMLQRLGRLHRHNVAWRPLNFVSPEVVVLVPERRDLSGLIAKTGVAWGKHGIGMVYGDLRILEATWRQLETAGVLHIPEMNRALVEDTTHPEALGQIVQELGGRWLDHQNACLGEEQAFRSIANLSTAHWEVPFGDPGSTFDGHKLGEEVKTRLGEGDRIVAFDPPVQSPWGNAVKEVSIPFFMARGVGEEPVSRVEVTPGGFVFQVSNRVYRYDRLGLRPMDVNTAVVIAEGGISAV